MFEAERLDAAAWALDRQADNVRHIELRVRSRVREAIDGGRWKGDLAERHALLADDRKHRMSDAARWMNELADRFQSQARQLREEERRRRAAAAAAAAR
jgi:hypothetical protein